MPPIPMTVMSKSPMPTLVNTKRPSYCVGYRRIAQIHGGDAVARSKAALLPFPTRRTWSPTFSPSVTAI